MDTILNSLPVAIEVLKDWRVIFIAIFTIFFISIASYVVKYRRKAPRIIVEKEVPAPSAEKSEENQEADGEGEE